MRNEEVGSQNQKAYLMVISGIGDDLIKLRLAIDSPTVLDTANASRIHIKDHQQEYPIHNPPISTVRDGGVCVISNLAPS